MLKNHQIRVELADRSYWISVAHNADPGKILELVRGKNVLLVTDSNTEKIFGERYTQLLGTTAQKVTLHSFPAGESSKNMDNAMKLCGYASSLKLGRNALFAALGGGVTRSLSVDMHGKGLSSYLLDMEI